MAKQNIKSNTKAAPIKDAGNSSLWDSINTWCEKKRKGLFYFTLVITLLFSILHFNARISEGNDDSLYIEAGYNFAKDFFNYFYDSTAPFYPMTLGFFIAIFGMNLIILKIVSVIFNLLFIVFFHKAFKDRIPSILLFFVLLFSGVNAYFQYYASQTYTEAFFLFIQAFYLFQFFKLLDILNNQETYSKKRVYLQWAIVGFLLFFITMSRNAAAILPLAVIVFFAFRKEWKNILFTISSYLIFKFSFEIIRSLIWGTKNQYSAQGNMLFHKDPYDFSKGSEDFAGFVTRFFDNCNIYLSRRTMQIMGFASDTFDKNVAGVAFIVIVLFAIGLILALRKKHAIFLYAGLHVVSIVAVTFIALQQRWDQPRFIMVHLPLIFLLIFYGLYLLVSKSGVAKNFLATLLIIIFCSSFISSARKISDNLTNLSHNLKGDKYYGYTPDWKHFLQMSEWCADNLPDSAYVASRKAPMSFVYGKGTKFFPIYKVMALDTTTKYSNPDSVLAIFKRNKVTHVILGSLRRDPSKNDGDIINTVHRVIQPVAQKYPSKVKLIHQIPTPEQPQVEPSYLYEIKN